MDEIELLYEDNHLLIVVKPYGVPSQADASGDPDMLTRMKAYIKAAYSKPGEVYLGLVHRLDRPVGGIMCFARTSKAAARLSAQLKGGAFKKTYLAVVEGSAPESGELTDYLFKVADENRVYVVDEHTEGAKPARLSFRRLDRSGGLSLLEIELHTGRPHQIRAQMANAGLPIYGDHRYGNGKSRERIALFAARLSIEHPTRKERLEFVKAPRDEYPWGMFRPAVIAFERTRGGVSVIYEDDALFIANKPAGIETQGENSAEGMVSAIVGADVFACHRLDAMTGGLLMFAKSEGARDEAMAALKASLIKKTYRCIVRGRPERECAELAAYLVKDADRACVSVHDRPVPGSKRIETHYSVLKSAGGVSLLEIGLITGRTHQIRAHMAFIGHPVLGDDKYGDRALNKRMGVKSQALWAVRLEFSDALDGALKGLRGKAFESDAWFSPKARELLGGLALYEKPGD